MNIILCGISFIFSYSSTPSSVSALKLCWELLFFINCLSRLPYLIFFIGLLLLPFRHHRLFSEYLSRSYWGSGNSFLLLLCAISRVYLFFRDFSWHFYTHRTGHSSISMADLFHIPIHLLIGLYFPFHLSSVSKIYRAKA